VAEAGAHLAGEHQPVVLVTSDDQRTESRAALCGVGEAADHEPLPQGALRFHPSIVAAWAVGQVAALGDDAFEAKPARLLEKRPALSLDMIHVADAPALPPAHQDAEPRLPLFERQPIEALALQSQQIEHEINE